MASYTTETTFTSLIIMRYLFISVVCITIPLMQVIEELVLPINSYIGTIIVLTYIVLSGSMFITMTYTRIVKDFDFKSKDVFGFC